MKTVKQLLRQPLKTLFGILLVALAVAILGVCVGQSMTAVQTEADLKYQFTTIALPTQYYNFKMSSVTGNQVVLDSMDSKVVAWIEEKMAENPELIETIAYPGLASAYIPALSSDNHANYGFRSYYGWFGHKQTSTASHMLPNLYSKYLATYMPAMFVVTLEEIGEMQPLETTLKTDSGEKVPIQDYIQVELQGRIDQVVAQEESAEDPVGASIDLDLRIGTEEEFEQLGLTVGKQYVVYGIDYYWRPSPLQEYVEMQMEHLLQHFPESQEYLGTSYDAAKVHYLTDVEKEQFAQANPLFEVPEAIYGDTSVITDPVEPIIHPETGAKEYRMITCILLYQEHVARTYVPEMKLLDYASMPEFSKIDGSVLQTRQIEENGETITISWDEYKERYGIPTIAPLEGSVEEFLAENELWQQTMDYIEINTHAFAMIGVEKLNYLADFNRGIARITQGRDFTQEELENGAKVCVISETLAQINGLSVGDAIEPQFYNYDHDVPYQPYLSDGRNAIYPNAYYFNGNTEFDGDAVEYTIVGLYRQDDTWGDIFENPYTFTPNTIFVPETSVASDMDYGDQGMFRTIILKNGCIDEFEAVMSQHEFESPIYGMEEFRDLFVYYDQGYSQVKDSFHNYQKLAQQVLVVGIVVYGIVLVLFLLLYPGRQGKTLRTMANFGTPRKDKLAHVLLSALGILLPGTILGSLLAMILWGVVVGRLLAVSGAIFSLTLDLGTLAAIATAQLLLALALTLLLAIPMTKHENLMKRK